MACRLTELVLDARDPEALARFWCEVLGWVELDREGPDVIEVGAAPGALPTLVISRTADLRRGKLPLHLDVNPTDRDQAAELERLLALGARPVEIGQSGDEQWHVLADPEGNEFCLLRSRVDPQ